MIASAVRPVDAGDPEILSPAGCCMDGAVMADQLARELLAGRRPARWTDILLVMSDVVDFVRRVTPRSDEFHATFAAICVPVGLWTEELAARVPEGTTVALRTRLDLVGAGLGFELERTLAPRCVVRAVYSGAS